MTALRIVVWFADVAPPVTVLTVVMVPAVMFVVLAIVPLGNVAAKKPVGCV